MSGDTSRLARRLGLVDAVGVGLGAMLGTGVFVVFAPAAARAGDWLLAGLLLAAVVAYCNATSTAQLAATYPQAGGAYAYGRRLLGPGWGALAGYAFVLGKTASGAAAALAVGAYAAPGSPALQRGVALAAVVAVTVVNLAGVTKTAAVTKALVAAVLAVLALVVVVANTAPAAGPPATVGPVTPYDVLGAAALLFFAFAGYARVATLGEEVRDPQVTIARAIPLALGIALVAYLAVAATLLRVLGAERLAEATSPLADAVALAGTGTSTGAPAGSGAGSALGWAQGWPEAAVRLGAVAAALGVLVSLVAGLGRTVFAMAAEGDLPRCLAAVSRRARVPHRAELAVGVGAAALAVLAGTGGLAGAVAFSACTVLVYYAVANAAALRLAPAQRRWPRALAWAGLASCPLLALTLPPPAVLWAIGSLGALLAVRAARTARRRRAART